MNKIKSSLLIIIFILMSVNISTANEITNIDFHETSYSENINYNNISIGNSVAKEFNFKEFISNPIVSGILLIISISCLIIELFLPTYGIAGILSAISLVLFFVGNISIGYVSLIDLLFFLAGCILIVFEIFIPGFGIPGIAGIIMTFIGLALSMENIYIGLISVSISIIIGTILFLIIIKKGYKSKALQRIVLKDDISSSSNPTDSEILNRVGYSQTPLRPSGTISIDNKNYDAITEGEFIEKGIRIEVIKVEGFKIIVRRKL